MRPPLLPVENSEADSRILPYYATGYRLYKRPDTALLCGQIPFNILKNKNILKLQLNLLQPGFYN